MLGSPQANDPIAIIAISPLPWPLPQNSVFSGTFSIQQEVRPTTEKPSGAPWVFGYLLIMFLEENPKPFAYSQPLSQDSTVFHFPLLPGSSAIM